jgi:16S rRNA G966 N2-methylase RsmD
MADLRATASRSYGAAQRVVERFLIDRRLGLPTNVSQRRDLEEFGLAHPDRFFYEPTPWGVLRRTLRPSEIDSDDVFIDLGSGMGRVVLEAATLPFKRAIGVEIAPELTAIATRALDHCAPRLRCQDVRFVTANVAEFQLPEDISVVYLHDPFQGNTLASVVERLVALKDRTGRRFRIVCYAPVRAARGLEATGRVRFVRYGRRQFRRWAPAEYARLYEIVDADDRAR